MSTDPNDRVDAFLANAISAARDAAGEGADDGAATRLRVRESLTQRPPRRRFTLIAAIVGTMIGGTAFAYVGAVKAGWVSAPSFLSSTEEPDDQPTTSMTLPESATKRTQIAAAPPDIAPEPLFEPAPLPPEPAPVVVAPTPPPPPVETPAPVPAKVIVRTPAPPPTTKRTPAKAIETAPPIVIEPIAKAEPLPEPEPKPEPTPAPAQPDAELSAYRAAHDIHFKRNDAKAALAAWDAYLAKYPNGNLAPEARWDRALVLVKLGRYKDARAALQPFANGTYRQKEALEILAAIKDR